jgi:hypothetical protein
MLAALPAAIADPSEHPSRGQHLFFPVLFCRVTIRRVNGFRPNGAEFPGLDWPPNLTLCWNLINTR